MRATRGRTATLAIGVPVLLAAFVWGAIGMVGVFARTSEQHHASYPFTGGTISLDVGQGSVRIQAGTAPRVEVAYTEHYSLQRPTVSTTRSSAGLQLRSGCSFQFSWYGNCSVNYVLTVPATAQLSVRTGDGPVRLTGTRGSQSVRTGDGSITLDSVGGAVEASTGDGSIHASALQANSLQARTGDGSIDLTWAAAPRTVTASTGDGSIHLTVPAGSGPYDVSTHTGDGSVHTEVATDPAASAAITARTGDGSITIAYPSP